MRLYLCLLILFLCVACGGSSSSSPTDTAPPPDTTAPDIQEPETTDPDTGPDDDAGGPQALIPMEVLVLMDGEPCPDCLVVQGGNPARWTTNAEGNVTVDFDPNVFGDAILMASHRETRITPVMVDIAEPGVVLIRVDPFDTTDNPDYVFKDPGEPKLSFVIEKCGHCHVSIQEKWYISAHKTAASNPAVRDVYAGTASSIVEEARCLERGGQWKELPTPGSKTPSMQCELATSVASTGTFGHCANCHAPGIDGPDVGNRDLQDTEGWSHDYGVHCDVCHRVESVDMDSLIPGVGGRLKIMRPSETPKIPDLGAFAPLTFGPSPDVGNVYMGSAYREHYIQSEFCAGCHEQQQEVLLPGVEIDASRWPSGRLPIHSTYSEWKDSPMAGALTCQGCHMPSFGPEVLNGADLQNAEPEQTGIVAGWIRPAGSTHSHEAIGPRTSAEGRAMLNGSVAISNLTSSTADGVLTATVEVSNAAGSHGVPTGEPMRSLVMRLEATCDGQPLAAVGGHVVPDFGGAYAQKENGQDWTLWPGAEVGQVIRVIQRTGEYHDYTGYGSFGDGTFDATQKGMPVEEAVGMATITQVDGDTVTLDAALPAGDRAYRVDAGGLPVDGEAVRNHAGAPGFAFARVLAGPLGDRMVPHFMAVDVVSDNRLMPGTPFTSQHRFDASACNNPVVTAVVPYRSYPPALAAERGWTQTEAVLKTATDGDR